MAIKEKQKQSLKVKKVANKDLKAKTIDQFRDKYDDNTKIPRQIADAVKKIGKNQWMYEIDFAKEYQIDIRKINSYRDFFSDYTLYVKKDRRWVWCGSVELMQKLSGYVS